MLVVGVTGGIGAGKSTFAALLAERGAHVIDADVLGREALAPGSPAWRAVVEHFGNGVLVAGSLDIDRTRLAAIVFSDPSKLAVLNAVTHPVILGGIADELEVLRGTDTIVVLDAALVVDLGLRDIVDVVVVVSSSVDNRRERLMATRGMTRDDVTARMSAQATEEELHAAADILVENDGTKGALAREADRVWAELKSPAAS